MIGGMTKSGSPMTVCGCGNNIQEPVHRQQNLMAG